MFEGGPVSMGRIKLTKFFAMNTTFPLENFNRTEIIIMNLDLIFPSENAF